MSKSMVKAKRVLEMLTQEASFLIGSEQMLHAQTTYHAQLTYSITIIPEIFEDLRWWKFPISGVEIAAAFLLKASLFQEEPLAYPLGTILSYTQPGIRLIMDYNILEDNFRARWDMRSIIPKGRL